MPKVEVLINVPNLTSLVKEYDKSPFMCLLAFIEKDVSVSSKAEPFNYLKIWTKTSIHKLYENICPI